MIIFVQQKEVVAMILNLMSPFFDASAFLCPGTTFQKAKHV